MRQDDDLPITVFIGMCFIVAYVIMTSITGDLWWWAR